MQVETDTKPTLRQSLERDFKSAEEVDPNSIESETLRLVLCAVRDRDNTASAKDCRNGCEEAEIIVLLDTMADQRRVSAKEYDDAGKFDLADRERDELAVIDRYLPKPLNGDALESEVDRVVEDLDAAGLKDVGKCMNELKSRFPHRIDVGTAGKAVKRALG